MTFLASFTGKIIAGLAIILLVVGGLYLKSCSEARQRAAQSRVDQGQAGAFHNSASDAIATQGQVAANESAGAALTRLNEEEIRHAKGADQGVDPGVRDAGLRSLCRRPAYRNNERCRVLQPHTP